MPEPSVATMSSGSTILLVDSGAAMPRAVASDLMRDGLERLLCATSRELPSERAVSIRLS